MNNRTILFAAAMLVSAYGLVGCSTMGSSARWWNPSTWFSASSLRSVQATQARIETTKDAAIKAAQKTAHETEEALDFSPQSRPVDVATEANHETVSLLDQVAGPLSLAESSALRSRVSGLISEVAEVRANAEKDRSAERATSAKTSAELAELNARFAAQSIDLQSAFSRENSIANSYRNLKWGFGIVLFLAVVGYIGMIYLKTVYGGLIPAVGKTLISLRASHPEAGAVATSILDAALSPSQQAKIAAHA